MAEARFDLVILHHASDKSVEDLVQELLQLLGKAGDPYLEYKLSEALLFEQSSSAILDNIGREEGERYQQKFRQLKVETELRPTLQLVAKEQAASDEEVEQYICPACKHSQPKQMTEDAMNTCNRCGVVGEKLARSKRKKEIFSTEKRKLEQTQDMEMKAAAIRARTEDEAAMRKEAQEKLGLISKNKNTVGVGVAIGGVVIIGVTSFFIIDALINNSEEITITKAVEVTDDPGAKKQPLITIEAGNGSIVINNDQASNVENAGNSGSKGSTGEGTENGTGTGVSENQLAGDTTAPADQSGAAINAATNNVGSTDGTASQPLAEADPAIPASQPAQQDSRQASAITTATNATTLENQPLAVAAVSPATQEIQEKMNGSTAEQATTKAKVSKTASALSKMATAVTSPTELSMLNTILSASHSPEYFFDKLDKKQFEEHQARLQRLLALGKPALALVFAESMEDPYPTALMVLDIAQYEAKNNRTELFSDLLLSMKSLATQGDSAQQNALLNASLSQVYTFAGEQDSARALLEKSVELLEGQNVSLAEHCQLLAQIEQKQRKFGNKGGADFIAEKIVSFASTLSDKDYIYASRAYTHLAAASLIDKKQDEARDWLNQIPVQDAKEYLLAEMVAISAAANKTTSR